MTLLNDDESLFVNPEEFRKAAIHAHKEFLATPYTCPNKEGERAICLLEDGRVIDYFKKSLFKEDGSLDSAKVEAQYHSKVSKVIYRPNHEILHTLRQAALIPKVKEYFDKNAPGKYDAFDNKQLERMQAMMLFVVVGRKDETGFGDDQSVYKDFRASSAKAFLEYAKNYPGLYDGPDGEKALYHDALMLEIMGSPTIPPTELLQEYEIGKMMVEKGIEFPDRVNDKTIGTKLNFMNIAHGLDLLRVYRPTSSSTNNMLSVISKIMSEAMRHQLAKGELNASTIKDCIKDAVSMLQYTRKMLDASGEKQKTYLISDQEIEQALKNPKMLEFIDNITKGGISKDDFAALTERVAKYIAETIMKSGGYDYDAKRFEYCHYKNDSNLDQDRDFETEVEHGISMLNGVARPEFTAELPTHEQTKAAEDELTLETSKPEKPGSELPAMGGAPEPPPLPGSNVEKSFEVPPIEQNPPPPPEPPKVEAATPPKSKESPTAATKKTDNEFILDLSDEKLNENDAKVEAGIAYTEMLAKEAKANKKAKVINVNLPKENKANIKENKRADEFAKKLSDFSGGTMMPNQAHALRSIINKHLKGEKISVSAIARGYSLDSKSKRKLKGVLKSLEKMSKHGAGNYNKALKELNNRAGAGNIRAFINVAKNYDEDQKFDAKGIPDTKQLVKSLINHASSPIIRDLAIYNHLVTNKGQLDQLAVHIGNLDKALKRPDRRQRAKLVRKLHKAIKKGGPIDISKYDVNRIWHQKQQQYKLVAQEGVKRLGRLGHLAPIALDKKSAIDDILVSNFIKLDHEMAALIKLDKATLQEVFPKSRNPKASRRLREKAAGELEKKIISKMSKELKGFNKLDKFKDFEKYVSKTKALSSTHALEGRYKELNQKLANYEAIMKVSSKAQKKHQKKIDKFHKKIDDIAKIYGIDFDQKQAQAATASATTPPPQPQASTPPPKAVQTEVNKEKGKIKPLPKSPNVGKQGKPETVQKANDATLLQDQKNVFKDLHDSFIKHANNQKVDSTFGAYENVVAAVDQAIQEARKFNENLNKFLSKDTPISATDFDARVKEAGEFYDELKSDIREQIAIVQHGASATKAPSMSESESVTATTSTEGKSLEESTEQSADDAVSSSENEAETEAETSMAPPPPPPTKEEPAPANNPEEKAAPPTPPLPPDGAPPPPPPPPTKEDLKKVKPKQVSAEAGNKSQVSSNENPSPATKHSTPGFIGQINAKDFKLKHVETSEEKPKPAPSTSDMAAILQKAEIKVQPEQDELEKSEEDIWTDTLQDELKNASEVIKAAEGQIEKVTNKYKKFSEMNGFNPEELANALQKLTEDYNALKEQVKQTKLQLDNPDNQETIDQHEKNLKAAHSLVDADINTCNDLIDKPETKQTSEVKEKQEPDAQPPEKDATSEPTPSAPEKKPENPFGSDFFAKIQAIDKAAHGGNEQEDDWDDEPPSSPKGP